MNEIGILNKFDPISLNEMDRVKLLKRVDTKYLISKDDLSDVLLALLGDYYILEINDRRIFSYHTNYFDTPDKKYFREHHQGKTSRHKVRFRNYKESDTSFLEIKYKYKGETNKLRIKSAFDKEFSLTQREFIEQYIPEKLELLQSSLENTFNRITLIHKTLNERATIDLDINFISSDNIISLEKHVIIEIKQERRIRTSLLYKSLKSNGFRPIRISKYCIGSVLTDKTLTYNAFKHKLLKINQIQSVWNS